MNNKRKIKNIKKAAVFVLCALMLENTLFSINANALETVPAAETLPQATIPEALTPAVPEVPTVPAAPAATENTQTQKQETTSMPKIPAIKGTNGETEDASSDMQMVPSTVNVVNGLIEAVFEEDKEAVVEESTKRVTPKWQSERKSAVKDHDYYIKVNKKTNTVTVYIIEENGDLTPYKAMVCSIGRAGHETPEGTGYRTTDYYDWRIMVDNTYGRYAVRFNGSILFHSVPYYESKKDSLEWQDYNKLGEPASLGCVRLAVADSKWIFDNCKRGTKVDVYSGPASTDPLGKPEPIKLDTNSPYRDWDPTDLTPENPWLVPVE